MTRDEYVGRYLDKKMKNNTLPYGMKYLNLVAEYEEKAEKLWERSIKKKLKENKTKPLCDEDDCPSKDGDDLCEDCGAGFCNNNWEP